MIRLVMRRLVAMIGVLLALAAILFFLARLTPTDPVKELLGPHATPAAIAATRHELWLDRPLPVQYIHYVSGLLHGNFQTSIRTRRPVRSDLASYVPATLELAFFGLALAILMGLVLAFMSAAKWKGSGLLRFFMVSGASAPVFLLALLGILLFYRRLGVLPATGQTNYLDAPAGPTGFLLLDSLLAGRVGVFVDALRHLILPALCVAIGPAVAIGRVLRSSLIGNLNSDYVRTARAKGLKERTVLWRHALRNSIGPALSMTGLQAGLMFAGVVVVEIVFAWPGVGTYTAQSIAVGDFPAVAGVTLAVGIAYVVINTAVDILQAVADPRLRT